TRVGCRQAMNICREVKVICRQLLSVLYFWVLEARYLSTGTHNSSKGSVDTPHTGVDTMLQALSRKMKKWSSSVDTRSSSVDTRPSSHVSTLDKVVSTLETLPREAVLPVWDSVSAHPMGRSTHSRNSVTSSLSWTRGTLGVWWIGLGSCGHDPQGYFWTF
ncbi:hypothetical protein Taro_002776, partial [Colocasia esculenta]|nr:hypothetical protein [Colocasia esculenta]